MKFRLTIGENGTPWGEQTVLKTGVAASSIEFVRSCLAGIAPDDKLRVIENCWVDTGNNTIAIAVCNLKIF